MSNEPTKPDPSPSHGKVDKSKLVAKLKEDISKVIDDHLRNPGFGVYTK